MKYIFIAYFFLLSVSGYTQETKPEFDGHTWVPPYHLPMREGWGIERFLIPASFAPKIAYHGVEDIRFAPGWAKSESEEYWTYAFIWYLDGKQEVNAQTIAANLTDYYTGLSKVNTDSTRAAGRLFPAIASVRKVKTEGDDLETYKGRITMTDYMQLKQLTLYCKVRLLACTAEDKTIVFFELSPKPYRHANWAALRQFRAGFRCKKD